MKPSSESVDAYVDRAPRWQDVIRALRATLLGCGLEEELKWRKPCYTFEGRNVAIIQPFKEHCALMFFKGVLLEDTRGLLRSQGENSQAARRLEFTSATQVKKTIVAAYVRQAVALEKEGRRVDFRAARELELPDELTRRMRTDAKLAKAFRALTPGRQRGYVIHITGAKQSATRAARVERCVPKILAGKGFQER